MSFWAFAKLVTTFIFFLAWDKTHVKYLVQLPKFNTGNEDLKYLSVKPFLSILEDDLSPIDSQDIPIEGPDQTHKVLYESDNGNYIDFSNDFDYGELIIGSKDGENFTYMKSDILDSGVEIYFLSDDPQTTVHIEFISKY